MSQNKLPLSWNQIEKYCTEISISILKSGFKPDYVVGITRGGLVPAVLISHTLEVPMHTLQVQLRDGKPNDCESNCWMSEDAFGYAENAKNILVVDDINDSGDTINWIKWDWRGTCLPNDPKWDTVWGMNVRFATVVNNLGSKETVDYSAFEINKTENDIWIDFPWERS
jgi:hypoxanthine phosphoribosyltransferase